MAGLKSGILLELEAGTTKCDVCGHEPVDCWLAGFGCDRCVGAEAVLRACDMAWNGVPREELS
jgi:hypothetical protein